MRWIYISPHLDDSVLSAGGLIYEQTRAGMDVEIWTFMCGYPPEGELSPFAQLLHFQWGISAAADVISARREEDKKAAAIVGAKAVHFDFLDCIYRRNLKGEWLYGTVFTPPHEDDVNLPSQISEAISARLQPDDKLICQFAIGSHVDHVLVRRAVELLQRPLLYLADVPYVFNTPEDLPPNKAGMKETVHVVGEAGVRSWGEAVAAYESQISSLFDGLEGMNSQIRQYSEQNGGIRLWSLE